MIFKLCIAITVLFELVAWSQVDPNAADAAANVPDQTQMLTPPPVNGESYPIAPAAETRSNYLRYGMMFSGAYSDNVLGGVTPNPLSDVSYSVWPTLALDESTPRFHSMMTYSPGFTFYQRSSALNQMDQNLGLNLQYRLSPHVTVNVRDSLQKTSNAFNQPNPIAGGVYGSPQVATLAVMPPLADVLTNTSKAELTYQFRATGMIGGSGTFTNLHYGNEAEVPGLYDSSSRGGSAFYSHRLSKKHYIGTLYQYSKILAFPVGPQFETQTHTVLLFYTFYLKPTFSLSFSGGPQHYAISQFPIAASNSWSPAATASLGWQGQHTTLAVSYSRTVTGGGGLLGAFESNSANASARWQMARTWNIGSSASYAIYKTLTSSPAVQTLGGHTVSGAVSLQHPIGEHFSAELGYTRAHQSFIGIAAVSTNPNVSREFISISYQFSKPLGR